MADCKSEYLSVCSAYESSSFPQFLVPLRRGMYMEIIEFLFFKFVRVLVALAIVPSKPKQFVALFRKDAEDNRKIQMIEHGLPQDQSERVLGHYRSRT